MSYSFSAIGDYARINSQHSFASDNSASLVAGWFYPTTLTATRKYWGAGTIIGAEVDATTSEIRMRTDNTTDGQWLTSGAGIVTNKWQFIAWLNASENTTVPGQWRVWVGDAERPPVAVTVTNPVVRSGNYTGNTGLCAGNADSSYNAAFQGLIGWLFYAGTTYVGVNNPLFATTSGVISSEQEQSVYQTFVFPLWEGGNRMPQGYSFNPGSGQSVAMGYMDFNETQPRAWYRVNADVLAPQQLLALGVGGVVVSGEEPPKRMPSAWIRNNRNRIRM